MWQRHDPSEVLFRTCFRAEQLLRWGYSHGSDLLESLFRIAGDTLPWCGTGFTDVRKRLSGTAKEALPYGDTCFSAMRRSASCRVFLLMRCVPVLWRDALKIVYLRPDVLSDANKAFSRTYGWAEVRARWWFVRFRAMPGHSLRLLVITQPYDVWRR